MDKNVKNVKYELVSSVNNKLKEVLVTYTLEGENYHYYIFLAPKSGASTQTYLKLAKEKFEAKLETGEVFESASRAGKHSIVRVPSKDAKTGKVKMVKVKAPRVRGRKRPLIIAAISVGAVAALAVGGFLTYKYIINRDNAEKVTYRKMREYVSNHYDEYALDTVPAKYTANINKMVYDIDISYITPTGGENSFTVSFGLQDIHITYNDQYAISLSSALLDAIERYYSDFVAIAVSIEEEPPIKMDYYLLDGGKSKIDFTTRHKLASNFFIDLLRFGTGALDIISTATGYLPIGETPETPIGEYVWGAVQSILDWIGLSSERAAEATAVIFTILDYCAFTISESSESSGNKFNTYLITDKYGFIKKMDFNFVSDFDVSGEIKFKQYDSATPEEGDQPIATDSPYIFSATGSVNFDFDISTEYAH